MTLVTVKPEALLPGDPVFIGKTKWTVRVIEGPDQMDTYDLYLSNENGDCHMVVRDPIQLINE